MIDQAGILMAQGLGIASERIQGVNDNMSQSHYHEYYEIYYLEAGERFHMVEDQLLSLAAMAAVWVVAWLEKRIIHWRNE